MCRVIQLYGIGYTVSRHAGAHGHAVTPRYQLSQTVTHRQQNCIEDCDQVLAKCSYTKPVWSGSAVGDLLGTTAGLTILHYSVLVYENAPVVFICVQYPVL